eukprot:4356449-Alexandrium_andersonii.AAC.1
MTPLRTRGTQALFPAVQSQTSSSLPSDIRQLVMPADSDTAMVPRVKSRVPGHDLLEARHGHLTISP